jgi:hypothetical protein
MSEVGVAVDHVFAEVARGVRTGWLGFSALPCLQGGTGPRRRGRCRERCGDGCDGCGDCCDCSDCCDCCDCCDCSL